MLHEKGLFADAVSRSYYAVLHAAKAALLVHEIAVESHAAVRRHFGQALVKPGFIEKEWAAIISAEQDQRMLADYDAEAIWETDASQQLVENAGAFVQRIHDYISEAEEITSSQS